MKINGNNYARGPRAARPATLPLAQGIANNNVRNPPYAPYAVSRTEGAVSLTGTRNVTVPGLSEPVKVPVERYYLLTTGSSAAVAPYL